MKTLNIIALSCVFTGIWCHAEVCSRNPPASVLAFETKTKGILEAAKDKDWWGYYDMPRLSLNAIKHSFPEVGQYYTENPDQLLALQADTLNVVYNMMDKTYRVDAVPLEDRQLSFNGNVHMSLLKKQRQHPETLTAAEKAQLKFMREKELSNFYQAYLALCKRTIQTSSTNTVTLSRLKAIVTSSIISATLKPEILSTNTVTDTIQIQ